MDIAEAILSGQPVPCKVVDPHCHLTPHYYRGWYQGNHTTRECVRRMDRHGVAWTVTAPHPFVCGYHDLANRQAKQATQQFPDRIKGYITVNPCWSLSQAKAEVATYIDDPDFIGFKLLPEYQGPILSPVHEYALATANQRKMPVLIHTWKELPTRAEAGRAADKYPDVGFMMAHGGGYRESNLEFIELLKDHPNMYIEISGSVYCDLWLEEIVDRAGADQVIFGTDHINCEGRFEIGRVGLANISEQDKKKLFAENFLALVHRVEGKNIPS